MGKQWKQCQTLFWGASKSLQMVTAAEIKRCLLLGRKINMLDSILKSRDVTLPTKVHLVKAMVCPVVMYGCKCWAIKRAEHQRIDAFELWCWRRLLSLQGDKTFMIFFKIDWFNILAVQGTLKSLLQHHSSEASILWPQLSSQSNSHIHTWPLEGPQPWLCGPLSAKWRRCFLTHWLGLS